MPEIAFHSGAVQDYVEAYSWYFKNSAVSISDDKWRVFAYGVQDLKEITELVLYARGVKYTMLGPLDLGCAIILLMVRFWLTAPRFRKAAHGVGNVGRLSSFTPLLSPVRRSLPGTLRR